MERNSVLTKLSLNKFVIIVFSYIIFIYYVFMAHFMLPFLDEYPIFIKTFLFLFHLSLIMFIWSILTAMLTEPGKVPQYWGFFLDESDQKKKRFCLICHIFKPDRCHHCSACNKCVLNMDHHCPWINNCIGFYNRKFFILMLFYILTTLFIVNLGMCLGIFDVIENIENFEAEYLLRIFPCITTIALFTVIGMFFKFHIYLILTNNTTIENLDRKRCPSTSYTNYDIGYYYNWVQVFGRQTFLWPFPIFAGTYGKPTGDGIIWPQLPVNRESVKNRELESSTITIENLKKTKKHENQESNDENSHGLGPKKDFSHVVRINYQKFIEEKNFENIKI